MASKTTKISQDIIIKKKIEVESLLPFIATNYFQLNFHDVKVEIDQKQFKISVKSIAGKKKIDEQFPTSQNKKMDITILQFQKSLDMTEKVLEDLLNDEISRQKFHNLNHYLFTKKYLQTKLEEINIDQKWKERLLSEIESLCQEKDDNILNLFALHSINATEEQKNSFKRYIDSYFNFDQSQNKSQISISKESDQQDLISDDDQDSSQFSNKKDLQKIQSRELSNEKQSTKSQSTTEQMNYNFQMNNESNNKISNELQINSNQINNKQQNDEFQGINLRGNRHTPGGDNELSYNNQNDGIKNNQNSVKDYDNESDEDQNNEQDISQNSQKSDNQSENSIGIKSQSSKNEEQDDDEEQEEEVDQDEEVDQEEEQEQVEEEEQEEDEEQEKDDDQADEIQADEDEEEESDHGEEGETFLAKDTALQKSNIKINYKNNEFQTKIESSSSYIETKQNQQNKIGRQKHAFSYSQSSEDDKKQTNNKKKSIPQQNQHINEDQEHGNDEYDCVKSDKDEEDDSKIIVPKQNENQQVSTSIDTTFLTTQQQEIALTNIKQITKKKFPKKKINNNMNIEQNIIENLPIEETNNNDKNSFENKKYYQKQQIQAINEQENSSLQFNRGNRGNRDDKRQTSNNEEDYTPQSEFRVNNNNENNRQQNIQNDSSRNKNKRGSSQEEEQYLNTQQSQKETEHDNQEENKEYNESLEDKPRRKYVRKRNLENESHEDNKNVERGNRYNKQSDQNNKYDYQDNQDTQRNKRQNRQNYNDDQNNLYQRKDQNLNIERDQRGNRSKNRQQGYQNNQQYDMKYQKNSQTSQQDNYENNNVNNYQQKNRQEQYGEHKQQNQGNEERYSQKQSNQDQKPVRGNIEKAATNSQNFKNSKKQGGSQIEEFQNNADSNQEYINNNYNKNQNRQEPNFNNQQQGNNDSDEEYQFQFLDSGNIDQTFNGVNPIRVKKIRNQQEEQSENKNKQFNKNYNQRDYNSYQYRGSSKQRNISKERDNNFNNERNNQINTYTQRNSNRGEPSKFDKQIRGNEARGNESRGNESRGNENKGNENRGNENRGNENRRNENRGNENSGNENRGNENRGNENKGYEKRGNEMRGNRYDYEQNKQQNTKERSRSNQKNQYSQKDQNQKRQDNNKDEQRQNKDDKNYLKTNQKQEYQYVRKDTFDKQSDNQQEQSTKILNRPNNREDNSERYQNEEKYQKNNKDFNQQSQYDSSNKSGISTSSSCKNSDQIIVSIREMILLSFKAEPSEKLRVVQVKKGENGNEYAIQSKDNKSDTLRKFEQLIRTWQLFCIKEKHVQSILKKFPDHKYIFEYIVKQMKQLNQPTIIYQNNLPYIIDYNKNIEPKDILSDNIFKNISFCIAVKQSKEYKSIYQGIKDNIELNIEKLLDEENQIQFSQTSQNIDYNEVLMHIQYWNKKPNASSFISVEQKNQNFQFTLHYLTNNNLDIKKMQNEFQKHIDRFYNAYGFVFADFKMKDVAVSIKKNYIQRNCNDLKIDLFECDQKEIQQNKQINEQEDEIKYKFYKSIKGNKLKKTDEVDEKQNKDKKIVFSIKCLKQQLKIIISDVQNMIQNYNPSTKTVKLNIESLHGYEIPTDFKNQSIFFKLLQNLFQQDLKGFCNYKKLSQLSYRINLVNLKELQLNIYSINQDLNKAITTQLIDTIMLTQKRIKVRQCKFQLADLMKDLREEHNQLSLDFLKTDDELNSSINSVEQDNPNFVAFIRKFNVGVFQYFDNKEEKCYIVGLESDCEAAYYFLRMIMNPELFYKKSFFQKFESDKFQFLVVKNKILPPILKAIKDLPVQYRSYDLRIYEDQYAFGYFSDHISDFKTIFKDELKSEMKAIEKFNFNLTIEKQAYYQKLKLETVQNELFQKFGTVYTLPLKYSQADRKVEFKFLNEEKQIRCINYVKKYIFIA